uniref:Retrotransposon protein, putative, Ty3-gypsy sub-class n=1 Tax=Oryza sativa subsp. japonica TaxID=39947 RepID=Q53K91_ORYSJ|nr:retrotransposon protein, putative, Ty3-gypsy sub-class [Oryza sativa Japonica Group]ABA93142.1 retrotransposon protein, putative, Ty3-gypsy subclass [Oryza sativa Japonica Group]
MGEAAWEQRRARGSSTKAKNKRGGHGERFIGGGGGGHGRGAPDFAGDVGGWRRGRRGPEGAGCGGFDGGGDVGAGGRRKGTTPTGGAHLSASWGEREGWLRPAHKEKRRAAAGWTGPTAQEKEKGGKRKGELKGVTARDLAEVQEDLQKMRVLVAGNERQLQGLENRMSELENNLSEIRGSLRVTYTGLHQLAGECGVTTTIPANPDKFSPTTSLVELATAMEAIPSKHAARIGEKTSNGMYTGACHVLACVKLAHVELDLQKILDQGAASDTRKDVMEEVGNMGESILPLFEE